MPASALTGALFLLLVDNLSRAATAMEIPLGITTSVIGAPLFLLLLLRTKRAWS
ncbi:MAG: iron chelate uptake ABC transporter family permease subunit [Tropicimonas sp.]|uniref:iron chelate uptake ABC transporter family permease subunit n=1 Tax=Tropicimonas sp. TaxID=2067044 RepID=UPI003A84E2A7